MSIFYFFDLTQLVFHVYVFHIGGCGGLTVGELSLWDLVSMGHPTNSPCWYSGMTAARNCFWIYILSHQPQKFLRGPCSLALLVLCHVSLSVVSVSATPWTLPARLLCPGSFPDKNTGVGLPFPPLGGLPDPESEPVSPALAGGFCTALCHLGSVTLLIVVGVFIYHMVGQKSTICQLFLSLWALIVTIPSLKA